MATISRAAASNTCTVRQKQNRSARKNAAGEGQKNPRAQPDRAGGFGRVLLGALHGVVAELRAQVHLLLRVLLCATI